MCIRDRDSCVVCLQAVNQANLGCLSAVLAAAAAAITDSTAQRSRVVLTAMSCVMARAWAAAPGALGLVLNPQHSQSALDSIAAALVQHAELANGLLQRRLITLAVLGMLPAVGPQLVLRVLPRLLHVAAGIQGALASGEQPTDLGHDVIVARGEPDDTCCLITNSAAGGAAHELQSDQLCATLDLSKGLLQEKLQLASATHGDGVLRQAMAEASSALAQLGLA
eukprot:TRINITY_DN14900_c0_g1_i1.p1 TRINITY_DN14900_c0_g1~~TRINITY_DN14900_c0_g1_i1.p1  ORF type:complete len:224 (+),score=76.95 TRINITY_DN14900_c0_g1_i1:91-762(+)